MEPGASGPGSTSRSTPTGWRPGDAVRRAADTQERLVLVARGSRPGDGGRPRPRQPRLQDERVRRAAGARDPRGAGRGPRGPCRDPALVAIAAAPGGRVRRTAVISPATSWWRTAARGTRARRVHHLLPPSAEAGRLIAFEVVTPGGNWSSYPPHKHDTEDPPRESRLEELYYYRFARPQGFAFARVYTKDGAPRRGDDRAGRRRRPRPRGLPPGRRPGGLRLLLPQRDGRPDPGLALHARPGPRLADELGARSAPPMQEPAR